MAKFIVDGMIQVNAKLIEAGKEIISLLNSGKSVDIIVQEHEETKKRSNPQNNLIYHIYERIASTLYGDDELLARRECKLTIGCRILLRDSESFKEKYNKVILNLDYETKLEAMDLISVSSLMTVKQSKKYITIIINTYTLKGCYFADLDGVDEYIKYPEVAKCKSQ